MDKSDRRFLTGEEFRKMQLLQLDLLVEFDRLCRKHSINYVIIAGTMLGAVRHKGFIPWDDDADIALLREDYEKFKMVCHEMNPDIGFFQDHTTDSQYRWGYAKLRRTGTKYIRLGQEHMKNKTGICIDVFPLDDVPQTLIGQMFQDLYCFCCRKILWSEVGKINKSGFVRIWYRMLSRIPTKTVFKWLSVYTNRSRNSRPNKVRILCFTSVGKFYYRHKLKDRYGMPKGWFFERAEYEFEGKMLYGSKDYDGVLTYWFNDYMTLPPIDKREQHAPVSVIDFGNL